MSASHAQTVQLPLSPLLVFCDCTPYLFSLERLSKMDPDYAASLERNDWYRLKRALDICTSSGRCTLYNSCQYILASSSSSNVGRSLPSRRIQMMIVSVSLSLLAESYSHSFHSASPFQFRCLFLTMPRIPLFQRIDSRCEQIVEQGLFQVEFKHFISLKEQPQYVVCAGGDIIGS